MALARRSLLDDPTQTDQEQNPAVDAMLQPPQPDAPFTSQDSQPASHPATQAAASLTTQHDTSQIPIASDRAPADPTYMTNAPAGAVSNLPTPAGYDQTKWNDPNNASHSDWKYTAGRVIAGGGTPEQAAAAIGGKLYAPGSDWIIAPDGEVFDSVIDYGPGGQNAPEWAHIDFDANGNYIPPSFGAGGGSGGGSGSGGGTGPNSLLAPGYTPPGTGGVYGNANLQQVGQDPMSQLIDSGIAGLIEGQGQTPLGSDLVTTIKNILAQGGRLNPDTMNSRLESAREVENKAYRAQLADARGSLADRGLLSEPGQPSGVEGGTIRRITEGLAPEYARNVRDIYTDEATRSDDRLIQSLTIATGLAKDQAANLLAATGQGTDRQKALADIALKSLDQNMQWNKFLASYGLTRDQVLLSIEQGRYDAILPLLAIFEQSLGVSSGGYV